MLMQNLETEPVTEGLKSQANISARLERLPITRQVFWARNIIGAATFFDGYTVIAIAYAMPVLAKEWNLTATQIGMILSFGYLGQLLGAVFFGWLAERIGRMKVLTFTILLFVAMDVACLFAWSAGSMILFRFLQGIGTGGEVPVASAYVNELIGSKKRGKFFLLYEVMFLLGLVGAGIIGYLLVPIYGWKAMFAVGLVPATILIPLRFFLFESPRWLASKGRLQEADRIVTRLENSVLKAGKQLAPAVEVPQIARPGATQGWRELFHGMYFKRSMVIWAMWFGAYMVANGLITWLPTLYRQHFNLPLDLVGLRLYHVGGWRGCRRHLRLVDRQVRSPPLVYGGPVSGCNSLVSPGADRCDVTLADSALGRPRVRTGANRYILTLSVLGRALSHAPACIGYRTGQCLVALGVRHGGRWWWV